MNPPSRDNPFRIIILGGGTAGWMAACLMAKRWVNNDVEISLIEAPDIGIIGVGEGSTPQLKAFFDYLRVREKEWMPKCNATYKNGIRFTGWSARSGKNSYFHPFPSPIDTHTAPGFYYNSHYRRQGVDLCADPDRFFLSATLAEQRLAPIPNDNFPFDIAYGYHFDAYLVGAFLREHAKTLGVEHIEAKISDIERSDSGDIAALIADNGKRYAGNFFVDSTGFQAVLLQKLLGVPFISFAENLFADSAVVIPTPVKGENIASQTTATALSTGWVWNIPLTNRTGNGYVYSSSFCSSDAAEDELRAHLGLSKADVEARHIKMKVGRVREHWSRNCLAVGLSQGFIEPLEATALHLVQSTVETFMDELEGANFEPRGRDRFNDTINARFEGVRDYIVCHYRANLRTDTEFWRANAANRNISESLHGILSCWFGRGDLKQEISKQNIHRFYSLTSWICLLGGYGNYPEDDKLLPANGKIEKFDMTIIDDFIRRCSLNFRAHKSVLTEQLS
ncbi:MAG: tryptophan halogenase family protein [Parvularculaceae bacterium]